MKTLFITTCLIALATAGFPQGPVTFGPNPAGPAFHTNSIAIGAPAGNTSPALGGFYYEVITAPSMTISADASLQDLLSAPWSDTGLLGTNTVLSGRMNGGFQAAVSNWPGGPGAQAQSFLVVWWSADAGSTWSQVAPKPYGASRVAQNCKFFLTG